MSDLCALGSTRLHLLIRILQTRVTVASRPTRSRTLSDSHTRWPRVHRDTQRPRISSVCVTCEEAPAIGTRVCGGRRIHHTAGVDTESVPIPTDLRGVAGTWHRAVRLRCCQTIWPAVVAIAFGAVFKALSRLLDFQMRQSTLSCYSTHAVIILVGTTPTRTRLNGLNAVVSI